MTLAQCRAARELLDWTQIKLAEASRIAVATVIRFERNGRPVAVEAVQTIQRALETADIEFIEANPAAGGPVPEDGWVVLTSVVLAASDVAAPLAAPAQHWVGSWLASPSDASCRANSGSLASSSG